MTRVVVTIFPESAERDFDIEHAILGPGVEIVRHRCDDEENLIAACSDAEVILTPHMAFNSDASMLESRKISARNIRNFLDGRHEDVRRYIHHAAM